MRLDAIYPRDDTYTEWLRYMVQSMPLDAPEMSFIAGLLSYCLKHNGLTTNQRAAVNPYLEEARAWVAFMKEEDKDTRPHFDNVINISDWGKE